MYEGLKHAHSGLRWIFLILLVYAIINAFIKWRGKQDYTEGDRKLGLFTFITSHIQLLIGLILYFISPKVGAINAEVMKNATARFFTVEHITMMIVAIVLISVGYSRAKKATDSATKFKRTFIFFLIALILVLVSIPWPPKHGAAWF